MGIEFLFFFSFSFCSLDGTLDGMGFICLSGGFEGLWTGIDRGHRPSFGLFRDGCSSDFATIACVTSPCLLSRVHFQSLPVCYIVPRSSIPCPSMASGVFFDSTTNRTIYFSMGVHRNAFQESVVAQIEAMRRTSTTKTSPVSVRLVQVQVQVHQESGVSGGGQSGTIHTSVPAQAQANLRILLLLSCLHLSLSFTAHFPAASPTHKSK